MEKTPMLNISVETLIRECSLKKQSNLDLYQMISNGIYQNHIHKVFGYRRFQYDFCDTMTCYNDGEHIIGDFHPSYYDFLYNILHSLGISTKNRTILDDKNLTEEMLDKVEELRNVSNERELSDKYPMLYHDLLYGRGYFVEAKDADPNTKEGKELLEKAKYCYQSGLRYNFHHFIEEQAKVYTRFINRRNDYKKSIESTSYNNFIKNHFDINKVMIYVVSKYVEICEKSNDSDIRNKYLKLIEMYQSSSYDKTAFIRDKDKIIDWPSLHARIQNLKKNTSKPSLSVEWELVPRGYHTIYRGSHRKEQTVTLSEKELNQLRNVGSEKEEFYEETPYLEKVVGLLKYKGYIAYIYENGEVLLDRQYNSKYPRTAKGNAIYHLKARDFEELSGHSKTFLQNDSRVERIIHTPKWKEKVSSITTKEGTSDMIEDAKVLVKNLREKDKNKNL